MNGARPAQCIPVRGLFGAYGVSGTPVRPQKMHMPDKETLAFGEVMLMNDGRWISPVTSVA
jgi:hypothetical protein